jgi:hypothetical protein
MYVDSDNMEVQLQSVEQVVLWITIPLLFWYVTDPIQNKKKLWGDIHKHTGSKVIS